MPRELSSAIVSALARGMAEMVRTLAGTIAALERRILDQEHKDPERILHELFQVRHELLTVRTMAGQRGTQPRQVALVLALMLGVVLAMLVWAKRHRWW